jgi:hypothetical protein
MAKIASNRLETHLFPVRLRHLKSQSSTLVLEAVSNVRGWWGAADVNSVDSVEQVFGNRGCQRDRVQGLWWLERHRCSQWYRCASR